MDCEDVEDFFVENLDSCLIDLKAAVIRDPPHIFNRCNIDLATNLKKEIKFFKKVIACTRKRKEWQRWLAAEMAENGYPGCDGRPPGFSESRFNCLDINMTYVNRAPNAWLRILKIFLNGGSGIKKKDPRAVRKYEKLQKIKPLMNAVARVGTQIGEVDNQNLGNLLSFVYKIQRLTAEADMDTTKFTEKLQKYYPFLKVPEGAPIEDYLATCRIAQCRPINFALMCCSAYRLNRLPTKLYAVVHENIEQLQDIIINFYEIKIDENDGVRSNKDDILSECRTRDLHWKVLKLLDAIVPTRVVKIICF